MGFGVWGFRVGVWGIGGLKGLGFDGFGLRCFRLGRLGFRAASGWGWDTEGLWENELVQGRGGGGPFLCWLRVEGLGSGKRTLKGKMGNHY